MTARPQREPDQAVTQQPARPLLGNRWWMPSAFAILAVLLLLIVPAVVDKRIGEVRNALLIASGSARVALNDLEASFASQLLVRNSSLPASEIPPIATRARLNADNAVLRVTVKGLGPEAAARYSELSDRLNAWYASNHDDAAPTAQEGLALLASAERLDSLLTRMSADRRVEVLRLERIDVISPAILAPIALIAIVLVMLAGRRTLRFARIAEEERAQVVRAGEARAALLRGVTHDIKNPLGAAAGYAELLEEGIVGPLPEKQLEMVRHIHRLVKTAVRTISDLLELARTDGGLQIEYASTELAAIVDEVVDDHRGMARERGVELSTETAPTPIVTDPQRVRQALTNLVSNAIKYTPSGGNVRVSIVHEERPRKREEVVGIKVRDTGPGIPADLQSKVFEEFFRVRNAGANGADGNGLGLAISRRIARLLGGDITYADGDAGGSVFTLWFPPSRAARTNPESAPLTTAEAG